MAGIVMSLKGRETELDVVRGVAIFLAMGWHLNGGAFSTSLTSLFAAPGRLVGWAGVDLFFVLSGFLVGGIILKELDAEHSFSGRRFLIRRAFRLWPVLYIYLGAQLLSGRPWQDFLLQNVFHVQNYLETPLDHLWSLAVEEHFYLTAALLVPIAIKTGLRPRHAVFALVAIILLTWGERVVASWNGIADRAIQWQTHFRIDGLALGFLMAILRRYYPLTFISICHRRFESLLIFTLAFASLVFFRQGELRSSYGYTIAAVGSSALIFSFYRVGIPKFLSYPSKLMQMLGVYSYSIYIWHNFLGNKVAVTLAGLLRIESVDIILFLKYLVSIAGGAMISVLIERPAMNLRDRIFPPSHRVEIYSVAQPVVAGGKR
ncbi:acyltransferase family protein [Rhizobium terrae]|uniref:acyltransferase family protein n=1 Tax=Rhizobium terrae TaxID=2171756 RepID=UPI000E3E3D35|nr:acyltransferase [Rhizobium terrae]